MLDFKERARQTTDWLSGLGLTGLPFGIGVTQHESDQSRFFLDTPLFEAIQQPSSSFVFATRGMGKSALKTQLMNAYRTSPSTFSIDYQPLILTEHPESLLDMKDHDQLILKTAAEELLVRLAFDPRRPLSEDIMSRISSFVGTFMYSPLDHKLLALLDSHSTLAVRFQDGAREVSADLPSADDLSILIKRLQSTKGKTDIENVGDLNSLLRACGYETTYLFLDEIDAVPSTVRNAHAMMQLIAPIV